MSETFAVEREDDAARGRYFITLPGGLEAEMTFRKIHGGTAISIDHTYTPPEFRGRNIAFLMMERAIADARRDGLKVRPECSYAVAQFARHPDWADLRA
jgi:uncharacterized protein